MLRIVVINYLPCLPAPLLGETTERLGNIEASPLKTLPAIFIPDFYRLAHGRPGLGAASARRRAAQLRLHGFLFAAQPRFGLEPRRDLAGIFPRPRRGCSRRPLRRLSHRPFRSPADYSRRDHPLRLGIHHARLGRQLHKFSHRLSRCHLAVVHARLRPRFHGGGQHLVYSLPRPRHDGDQFGRAHRRHALDAAARHRRAKLGLALGRDHRGSAIFSYRHPHRHRRATIARKHGPPARRRRAANGGKHQRQAGKSVRRRKPPTKTPACVKR